MHKENCGLEIHPPLVPGLSSFVCAFNAFSGSGRIQEGGGMTISNPGNVPVQCTAVQIGVAL